MADGTWDTFLNRATVVLLKSTLEKLNLTTSGNKAVLKLRIQEAVQNLSEEEKIELIPQQENDGAHGGEEEENGENLDGREPEMGRNDAEDENPDEEINRLRELVRKKQEISRLKKQLMELDLENSAVTSRSASYGFKDIEDAVPSFSGDDNFCVERWLELFEESAEAMQFDDRTKLIFGKRLVSGTAKIFLRTVNLKTWNELKFALKSEFKKHVIKADLHNQLRNRRKRREENFQQYVLAMQEIASAGTIDEEDLMHYIINGIQDTETNKMLLHNANSMSELKSAMRKYEKLKVNSAVNVPFNKKYDSSEAKSIKKPTNSDVKCFKCKEIGHYSKYCPKRRKEINPANKTPCTDNVMSLNNLQIICDETSNNTTVDCNEFKNDFERMIKYEFIKGSSECSTTLMTLLDSGSPISFVQQQYVPVHLIVSSSTTDKSYSGINGSPLVIVGCIDSKINFENSLINLKLLVVKDNTMFHSVILGRNFIQKNNMILKRNCNNENLCEEQIVNDKSYDIHIPNRSTDSSGIFENNDDDFINQILNITVSTDSDLDEINLKINEKLPFRLKKEIEIIIRQAWCYDENLVTGNRDNFQMHIKLTKDDPFYCAPRRLPFSHKVCLQKILDDLMSKGIIRESNSPYTSPIVLVKKKNGELRLCVDYRELNKVTVRDNYPLPLIEDHLDRLRKKKYFTTLDLKNGFHHVKVADESVKYTSFITPLGQYEYLRMPFGLKNAPSVFERFMKRVFGKLIKSGKVLCFVDDILLATETIEDHICSLKEIIDVIRENSLELRIDKCVFLMEEITYLGYKINEKGIRPSEDHLKAIKQFPIPSSTKDVHSFLGLSSYFRKFIKDFAVIAKPLYDLIRKDVPFVFGHQEFKAFELLKSKLVDSPVLSVYNPESETELHCDASSVGFGAVFLQKQKDMKFHPIFYFSKRATESESRLHSFELEALAIVYALRRFKIYLIGIQFKIVTDCQALSLTLNKKTVNAKISRWALEMQEFTYTLEHRKSERMTHADALSRAVNILYVVDESFEFVLAAAQRHDPEIVAIASELEKNESPTYEMVDGLIYRKYDDKILFYVPNHMVIQVIRTHHEAMGHMGAEKCHEFLLRTYWFPRMKSRIKEYIKTCLKCIYFSLESGKTQGKLYCIPKGNLPFETVHIDHFGPLSHSRTKKQYIFLVTDAFTKFVKLYPVKTTQTKEVIACLKSYFQTYSRPTRIVSDRGTCFTSEEFGDFLISNNVKHVKIASQCPQSNGQVERVNRVLTPMLAKFCDAETTSDWDRHLAKVEYSINNTVNRSTGFSPSMLLFGINQKGELCDRVFEYLKQADVKREDLNTIRNQACQNIQKCQVYNKLNYDKGHKHPVKYKVGDYVMLKNFSYVPGVNKKLFAKYKGPYEVEKVLSNDRYIVRDIEGLQLSRKPYKSVCAPCNMKPFYQEMGQFGT